MTEQYDYERARVTRLQAYELQITLGGPTKVEERALSIEDVKKATLDRPPDRLIIRHHPDDAVDALALVAGMEPWRYYLAETEEVPKGDPEIFVIDHMPSGGRRLW